MGLSRDHGRDLGAVSLTPPLLSDEERDRRRYAIDFGRGSVRYEGGILSLEVEALNARFVEGERKPSALSLA